MNYCNVYSLQIFDNQMNTIRRGCGNLSMIFVVFPLTDGFLLMHNNSRIILVVTALYLMTLSDILFMKYP